MRLLLDVALFPAGVTVAVSPLFPWPEDPSAWLRRTLLSDVDDTTTILAASDLETDTGWPLSLFAVEVNGETRVLALYRFLEWAGAALVRGAADAATRSRVAGALRSARPDFGSDEAICLADLWPAEGCR